MRKFFSVSDNSFYVEDTLKIYKLAGISLPLDLVEITDEEYNEFMISPGGKIPGYDEESGGMVWNNAPAPTEDEQRAIYEADKAALMRTATTVIDTLQDAVDIGMATDEEASSLEEWKTYRVLLYRVDPANASGIEWPQPPVST